MILVPLLNPKFANTLAARSCELRVRGTSNLFTISVSNSLTMFLHDRFTLPTRQPAKHIPLIANFMLFLVLAETGILTTLLSTLLAPM